jgi:hypothetical protein
MSIFAKKPDARDARLGVDIDLDIHAPPVAHGPAPLAYGIGDAIQLMRSLPVEQNMDLVVRVVRVTLSSVNVRIEDIIEDATRRQQGIQETIAALHDTVADLEEQLDARRRDIAAYEADLKETTAVKERLFLAEKSASLAPPPPGSNPGLFSSLPPPPPPGRLPKPVDRD